MAKAQNFPITIKAGANVIKIYRSPVCVPVTSKPDGKKEGGKKIKVTTYDSYVVVHYRGGKRERRRFNSLELAQVEASCVRVSLLNEDTAGLQITGNNLLAYTYASHVAKVFGLSLDQLAKEYDTARKLLGEVSVLHGSDGVRQQFWQGGGGPPARAPDPREPSERHEQGHANCPLSDCHARCAAGRARRPYLV